MIAPQYFPDGLQEYDGNPEEECSAKGWIKYQMKNKYKETIHQEKMSQHINLNKTAQESPSFRQLIEAVEMLISAIDNDELIVLPE